MNEYLDTAVDLTGLFHLFSENQELLRDNPVVRGDEWGADFEVVLEFTNLTGNEAFLNNQWLEDTLFMNFYIDVSLAQASLDLRSEAELTYHRVQNPEAFPEIEIITLSDVNWEELNQNYEALITGVTIEGTSFNMVFFEIGHDDLPIILKFLEENQTDISSEKDGKNRFAGGIHFRRNEEQNSSVFVEFFMNESQHEELLDLIGE